MPLTNQTKHQTKLPKQNNHNKTFYPLLQTNYPQETINHSQNQNQPILFKAL